MPTPFHPVIVHFPIVVATLMPMLIMIFAYMIKINKMTPRGWLMIIGLQLFITITGYVSLESGENEEDQVAKVVQKSLINAHEEAAEIFVGTSVVTLVLTIAVFFLRSEFQFYTKTVIAVISLIGAYLAYNTGRLGGELVYRHGAASAYMLPEETHGLLPTPDKNTSESVRPVNENESLNADENDYGDPEDESSHVEDFKQED